MTQKKTARIPFPHPGETIREDYLKPLGMSVNWRLNYVSRQPHDGDCQRPARHHHRYCAASGALLNTTARFWLKLQASCALAKASETKLEEIQRTVRTREAAEMVLSWFVHVALDLQIRLTDPARSYQCSSTCVERRSAGERWRCLSSFAIEHDRKPYGGTSEPGRLGRLQ
jgi:plasmid maintenance system antidote protein VapI